MMLSNRYSLRGMSEDRLPRPIGLSLNSATIILPQRTPCAAVLPLAPTGAAVAMDARQRYGGWQPGVGGAAIRYRD
jgi:hypothetical protein